eukprot:1170126-Rhodomonas_salina.1
MLAPNTISIAEACRPPHPQEGRASERGERESLVSAGGEAQRVSTAHASQSNSRCVCVSVCECVCV